MLKCVNPHTLDAWICNIGLHKCLKIIRGFAMNVLLKLAQCFILSIILVSPVISAPIHNAASQGDFKVPYRGL